LGNDPLCITITLPLPGSSKSTYNVGVSLPEAEAFARTLAPIAGSEEAAAGREDQSWRLGDMNARLSQEVAQLKEAAAGREDESWRLGDMNARLSQEVAQLKMEKEEDAQHRCFQFRIVTEADFRRYDEEGPHYDLYKFYNHPLVKFEKETSWHDFKGCVARLTGGSANSQRLWQWLLRMNGTYRPDTPLEKSRRSVAPVKASTLLSEVFTSQLLPGSKMKTIDLFVEETPNANIPVLEADSVLLLLKHYDPETESLRFISHFCRSKTEKLSTARGFIHKILGCPLNSPLDIYEEVRETMIQRCDWAKSFKDQELDHGDILIVQVPPLFISAVSPLTYPNVTDFFALLGEQAPVGLCPLHPTLPNPN